jgi:hypothetical protein
MSGSERAWPWLVAVAVVVASVLLAHWAASTGDRPAAHLRPPTPAVTPAPVGHVPGLPNVGSRP